MTDSLPLDIIVLGMIAVFLVMRLRSVLGRRTGTEKPRDIIPRRQADDTRDKVIPLPDRTPARGEEPASPEAEVLPPEPRPAQAETPSSGLQQALARIRAADPDFDPKHFVEGARAAFEMIVTA